MGLFLLLFLGCGEEATTIEITDFDQSCSTDEECTSVFVGSVCGCDCTRDGINISEIDNYNTIWNDMYNECEEVLECYPCPDTEAYCEENICKVR